MGPNPHVVRMFIAELGLDIETIEKKINFKISKKQKFIEYSPIGLKYLVNIFKLIKENKGGLLIIDYGYFNKNMKDTLKAIYKKKHSKVLENIGKSDITYNINYYLIKKITENALKNGIPKGVVLNVNIPSVEKSKIKGVKVCRQANASWVEEFDKRKNPLGQEYYWLTGKFVNRDKGEDTDEWALNQNYISIVPVKFDLTAHHAIQNLNEWNFK